MSATYENRDALLTVLKLNNPEWGRARLSEAAGIPPASVGRWLFKQRKKAQHGNAPQYDYNHPTPEGYTIKGVSTLYDKEGEVTAQWVKTREDRANTLELLQMAADAILEPCKGQSEQVKAPTSTNSNLMACYPIADVHLGLFAWAEETGTDFDAKKCEAKLLAGMQYLVDAAPPAETCLIPNLADFFHTDTAENKTLRSGHTLDIDTRWAKVFCIGVRCYREMISMALAKHKKVYVKSGIGNHDDHSILSLAMLMQAYFENNDRVEIELPISPFAYHKFGNTLIGINHGEIKADKLPLIMANDMRKEWGTTKHSHWLVGHIHHKTVNEYPGCTVESFRSVSAKDAWTHGRGYRAERDMQLIIYHRERGEVGRSRIGVDYL